MTLADLSALALEALPKAFVYACVMLSVGACVARAFRRRVGVAVEGFESRLIRLLERTSLVLLASLVVRAWSHTAVAFSLPESFGWENLRTIAWESQWGSGWQPQLVVALGLSLSARALGPSPRAAWTITAVLGLVLCYALPLLGHAAGSPWRMLLHGSHILGASAWLGTLAAIVLAASPSEEPSEGRDALLRHFSTVAFAGAGLLAGSGLVAAWLYLGSFSNLVGTTYGRVLLVKLFLVADVATCGFVNWQSLRRRAGQEHPARDRAVFAVLEVGLAVAVVAVTAILTELEHP